MKNKENKNFIYVKTNLITNFKPNTLIFFKQLEFFKNEENLNNKYKNTNRIYCKNFLLFILLLKYNNNFIYENSSIHIKKFKKKVFTILKSPYRHKLARHQISINRYEICSSICIPLNSQIVFFNWDKFFKFFNYIKTFNNIFESNIIYINSIKIKFYFKYKNNFCFKNFNN